MKTIIAGSRKLEISLQEITEIIAHFKIDVASVISGFADGIDACGVRWARKNKKPIIPFPVSEKDWKENPLKAGHQRNEEMAQVAEQCLLIWNGQSGGSKNMKDCALAHRIPVYEAIITSNGIKFSTHFNDVLPWD